MSTSISRRQLLGSVAAGSAAAVAAPFAQAACSNVPAKWDETTDVIVIGTGFAGLMAAYEVRKAGAECIVIDKMATPGGNSIINGGIMCVPGNDFQKKDGIEDSPEAMAEDMLKAGLNLNHRDKVKTVCEGALPAYRRLIDEFGVQWKLNTHEGGHRVPRSALTANGSGSEIVRKQLAALEKLGVKPRLRCIMDHIILDDAGTAVGLEVREGYRFGREESGRKKFIRARKGIVLAFGGFCADVEYRKMFDPNLDENFQSTNHPGATSEGIREANAIGAQLIQCDWLQCLPYTSPDEKGFGIAWTWTGATSSRGFWFDAATGRRFVNELADRKIRSDAIIAHLREGHDVLAFGDSKTAKIFEDMRPGMLERILKAGVCWKFDTLEALEKAYSIPKEAFEKTIAEVNESVTTKKDPLGRRVNERLQTLTDGPFYVTRISPKVHHSMGGILTTPKAEVVSIRGGIIPGLYAAGEATGGVHGAVRLGSCAVTDCIVNGSIAGREVAKRG
ncbi:flavocytochrome c [Sutterella sp.]|uniref:flavocytochrome c n=1 Tax=Sutterella sp. TaxID=1981025 RepID=UPI0026E0450B|nr:flavocytochrome c [Sutterella sp.]MDO5532371.1 flavocytochrome c [Sutterella sp.]